jgi:zinc-ribbon domain
MMYSNKLAVAIKTNGQVLREYGDKVYVKFNSEYSILIKNLHSTRAVVNVFIDGVNQTPSGLVIDAGRECDFERSLLNGSLTAGNKFKFIERTAGIEQHRGVQLEDGLVKIEYQFESAVQYRTTTNTFLVHDHYHNGLKVGTSSHPLNVNQGWLSASGSSVNAYNASTGVSNASYGGGVSGAAFGGASGGSGAFGGSATHGVYNVGGIARSADVSNGQFTGAVASAAVNQYLKDNNIKVSSGEVHEGCATMDLYNDTGITVSGSKSTQKFATTTMGTMDPDKFSMVIKLLGETPDNKPVLKPVTVKSKPKCVTCGTQNKATAHFCTKCGTALEIFA